MMNRTKKFGCTVGIGLLYPGRNGVVVAEKKLKREKVWVFSAVK
jgi:hypothetical protein